MSPLIRSSLFTLMLVMFSQSPSALTEYDRIIAIVNDDVIVASEIDRRVEQVRAQLENAGTPSPPLQVLQKQVLGTLNLIQKMWKI